MPPLPAKIRRQIVRNNGLHPAKQLHRQRPEYKYRNMEITENGVTGHWTTAGPTM